MVSLMRLGGLGPAENRARYPVVMKGAETAAWVCAFRPGKWQLDGRRLRIKPSRQRACVPKGIPAADLPTLRTEPSARLSPCGSGEL